MGCSCCTQLYELPSAKQRYLLLKNVGLYFKCGASFHGLFIDEEGEKPCGWNSGLEAVKCVLKTCSYSAATYYRHEDNTSPKLIGWLNETNIKFSFNTIWNATIMPSGFAVPTSS